MVVGLACWPLHQRAYMYMSARYIQDSKGSKCERRQKKTKTKTKKTKPVNHNWYLQRAGNAATGKKSDSGRTDGRTDDGPVPHTLPAIGQAGEC